MLKLTAKIVDANEHYASVEMCVGRFNKTDVLVLPIEEADELVGLLNAATDMRDALIGLGLDCWCATYQGTLGHEIECTKARAAIAKAKGPTP